jgi:hypothetical protein
MASLVAWKNDLPLRSMPLSGALALMISYVVFDVQPAVLRSRLSAPRSGLCSRFHEVKVERLRRANATTFVGLIFSKELDMSYIYQMYETS